MKEYLLFLLLICMLVACSTTMDIPPDLCRIKTTNFDKEYTFSECMPCGTAEAIVSRKRKESKNYTYIVVYSNH